MRMTRVAGVIVVVFGLALIQFEQVNELLNYAAHPYVVAIKTHQFVAQTTASDALYFIFWFTVYVIFFGSIALLIVSQRERLGGWLRSLDSRGRALGILFLVLLVVGIPKFLDFTRDEWSRGVPIHIEDPRGGSSDSPVFLHAGDSSVVSVETIVPGVIEGKEIECNIWAPESAHPALITPYALPHRAISGGNWETDVYCAWEFGTHSTDTGSQIIAFRISACQPIAAPNVMFQSSNNALNIPKSEPTEQAICQRDEALKKIYEGTRVIRVSDVPFSLTNVSVAVGVISVLVGVIFQLWTGKASGGTNSGPVRKAGPDPGP
jgi:hypothetical protein